MAPNSSPGVLLFKFWRESWEARGCRSVLVRRKLGGREVVKTWSSKVGEEMVEILSSKVGENNGNVKVFTLLLILNP